MPLAQSEKWTKIAFFKDSCLPNILIYRFPRFLIVIFIISIFIYLDNERSIAGDHPMMHKLLAADSLFIWKHMEIEYR